MNESRLVARCPAKINLSLRVLGRRADGYHEIETIFQAIDLWDEVEGARATTVSLTCDEPSLPTDETNLVVRSARHLARTFNVKGAGAALHLRKRIPAGGGLGGGSSDAAGTLVLLARLWGIRVLPHDLAGLAADLGADVPFFLHGGTAMGRGRGDRIERLDPMGTAPILLGCPPFPISTAEVYGMLPQRLTPRANDANLRGFSAQRSRGDDDAASAVNDLEAVVFRAWPDLCAFRDALWGEGAGLALLSGSGSTVFGVFPDAASLEEAQRTLGARFHGWRLIPTRAIDAAAHVVDSPGGPGSAQMGD